MKLLITTQKVDKDDAVLGFFHRWIEEFAKSYELVTIICLEEGAHSLPANVRVLSLGKENGASRQKYATRFLKYIWQERDEYDAVFVHMNPEYAVLGGMFWKLWGKRVALWYTHRQVNLKLRLAVFFADVIYSSAKESMRVKTNKARFVGHGIDMDRFSPRVPGSFEPLKILHLGRITRIKNIDVIMKAAAELKGRVDKFHIVGDTVTEDDKVYMAELATLSQKLGIESLVSWDGVMKNTDALAVANVSVNAAPHGGMDKSVLESFAAGVPCFVSNSAFRALVGDTFAFQERDSVSLAEKIEGFLAKPDKRQVVEELCQRVRREYSVENIIKKINEGLLLRNI